MLVLVLMVTHQIASVMQILLQFCSFFAVFVECTVLDQLVQFSSEVFEHEGFVDKFLIASFPSNFL